MRAVVIAFVSAALCWSQQAHRKGGHHHPRSTEDWIKILENPARDGWQKPTQVVEALGLTHGQHIADIGAGTGYFSVRFGPRVGPQGRVFAVEVDPGLVEHLRGRAKSVGLDNLEPLLAAHDDPRLAEKSVDWIFICDVVHHIENRSAYYAKLARALRPGGRIAIIDFYKRELPVGPRLAMKIAKSDMIAEFTEAGFSLEDDLDFLPYQYFLIFSPRP